MSETEESKILPEKNMIVLDNKSYNIIKTTVTDKDELTEEESRRGLIFKTSPDGNRYIIEKKVETFVIANDVENTAILMPTYGNINIFLSESDFNKLSSLSEKKLYDRDGFYYKSKTADPFSSIVGKKVGCYVIFDGDNSISAIVISDDETGNVVDIDGSSYSIHTKTLDNVNRNHHLILVNRSGEIVVYVSSKYINDVDDIEESNYDLDSPIIFYKRKSNEEIRRMKEETVMSEKTIDEKYEELVKEYVEGDSNLFTQYEYPVKGYKDDIEYKAIQRLISLRSDLVFKNTYKDSSKIYFKLFKSLSHYNVFLSKLPEKGESREMSTELNEDKVLLKTMKEEEKKIKLLEAEKERKIIQTRQSRENTFADKTEANKNELIDFLTVSGKITSKFNTKSTVNVNGHITGFQSDFSRRLFNVFKRTYVNNIKATLNPEKTIVTYMLDPATLKNNSTDPLKTELIKRINGMARLGGGSRKNKSETNNTTRKAN